jgi:cytoskeleton protein RodZ
MFRSSRKEPAQLDPAGALLREVGAQLRQVRDERGEDLEHVAQYLRIRPFYLDALEQGDLSVMPGRTYALGFLRSYADYLGFDGDELIARIRTSVADLTGRTRLRVRSPLPESRVPKTPIVVLSLAALAGVYAGWSYVDRSNRAAVEVVTEVPDDLQALLRDAPPETLSETAPPERFPSGTSVPEPGPVPEAAPLELPASVEPEAGPDTAGPVEPVIAALAPAVEEAPPPEQRSASDILARLEPVLAAGGAAPTLYGLDEVDARVILRARSRSWVQVSSADEEYRWVKTLEPGDAFVVPDRPDLVLWTGNAGGIEVIVDGAPLPPLGPDAGVVRDVPLQPGALLRRLLPTTERGTAP